MRIFVPREREPGEHRVAATPETVARFVKAGHEVQVEAGAGARASFTDAAYTGVGATLADGDLAAAWRAADVVVKVAPPGEAEGWHEAEAMREGALLIGFVKPDLRLGTVRTLRDRKVDVLAMELIPRITRAQSMDALSSQGSVAGYKAALIASTELDKYFPLLMTAAGTIQPARIVVMGAGVAGLQALATCRRLGATVEVSDIREAVKEEVESLGGRFIELPMKESGEGEGGYAREMGADFLTKQRAIVADRLATSDAAICTALIPGRPAPTLITEDMVKRMRPGAVIVDLAVERGGNCELSVLGETVERHGVTIVGHPNLPATVPADASRLYARNVARLIEHMAGEGGSLTVDPEDEVVGGTLLIHGGKVVHSRTAEALGDAPAPAPEAAAEQGQSDDAATGGDAAAGEE
ncbi:MAG: Re/Si-specific NAD(P)(+) transhydrogenase subunit alpha [Sandaracinaceae bacterium]